MKPVVNFQVSMHIEELISIMWQKTELHNKTAYTVTGKYSR